MRLFFNRHKKAPSIPITFYNSRTKNADTFTSIRKGEVRMYTCGPTVYDVAHIGNLRTYLLSDIARRVFEYNGYTVKHVINVTDIGHLSSDGDHGEDKMVLALKRENMPLTLEAMYELATRYTLRFRDDIEAFNIRTPFLIPRASDHIGEQIALIKTLEEKGYTYELDSGVYFDTERFPNYGILGGVNSENTEERVSHAKGKKRPQDFALWKKDDSIGFKSLWGKGFPGWHIECSAMSMHYLGKQFDVHTGGDDLRAIHHNNEIAQSEASTGKQFVPYWLHGAFLNIDSQKISKSIGNTITLKQIVDRGYPPFALRYLFLTAKYRTPLNFTWDSLAGAYRALVKVHKFFLDLGEVNGAISPEYQRRFTETVNNDLDTPKAISLMWELVDNEEVSKKDKRATLLDMNRVLGIGLIESYKDMKNMLSGSAKTISIKDLPQDVQELIEKREHARGDKDWKTADTIRGEIAKKGFTVTDTDAGPEVIEKS